MSETMETTERGQAESLPETAETELFLVLEGGGARGIAHVAAWGVLDELVAKPFDPVPRDIPSDLGKDRFRLTAVAGSSAGAIVAAFIAAGAKAEDLIDREGRVPLCEVLGVEYFYDIFGMREWRRLKHLKSIGGSAGPLAEKAWRFINEENRPWPQRAKSWFYPTGDMFFWIVLASVVFSLFYFWLDDADIFKRRGAEEIVFLLFWFVATFCFSLSNAILRAIDKSKRRRKKRHYSWKLSAAFHPGLTLLVSLLVTAIAVRGIAMISWAKSAFFDLIGHHISIFYRDVPIFLLGLRVLCGLAAGYTIVSAIRRFCKGTVSSRNLQIDLNDAFAAILRKYKPEAMVGRTEVTFDDLYAATGLSLSIVASDIVRNDVAVFTTEEHGSFSVAKAVTASLAIPFAFRSISDGERVLFDGGLISTLPAWLFRRHRTRDPDCRILAVGIESREHDTWMQPFFDARARRLAKWDEKFSNRPLRAVMRAIGKARIVCLTPRLSLFWPLRIAMNVGKTAAFGGRSLDLDFSDRLDKFPLQPRIGLLEFDITAERAKAEIELLKQEAYVWTTNLLWRRKIAFNNVCQAIEASLRNRRDPNDPVSEGIIRVFWSERDGPSRAMRIKFTYGFARDHLDDRLVLPFGSSMTAWAAQTGRSQFARADVLKELMGERMNRYRDAVKWRDRAWCWAIPLIDEGKVLQGVLSIESDKDLSLFDPVVGQAAEIRSDLWKGPDGKLLRKLDGKVAEPADEKPDGTMALLEADWRILVKERFVTTKLPQERRPQAGTSPQPDGITSRIVSLLQGFFRDDRGA